MEEYYYRLQMSGFPAIMDLKELSYKIHLSKSFLYLLWKFNNEFYKEIQLPKKGNGFRSIFCPSKEMKAVQAWILRNILDKVQISDSATGFRKGKNVLDNVNLHKNNRFFLCLDIENFFPSIPYAYVYTIFKSIGYNSHVSHILTSLCTCKDILPQGAVTSPALSNIICIRLDKRIRNYVGKFNITYTRYADDLIFSSMSPRILFRIKKLVIEILINEGFELNKSKTRVMGPCSQRKVTGLVISDNSVGIGRKRKKILRATIHHFVKKKLSEAKKEKMRNHINGWFAYLKSVDPKGREQLESYLNRIS